MFDEESILYFIKVIFIYLKWKTLLQKNCNFLYL